MTERAADTPRSLRALLVVGGLCALGTMLLIGLGIWQLERLGWKLALIQQVAERTHAAAIAPPGPADWPAITQQGDEYRHVVASGRYLNADETLVEAVTSKGGGFWVITPFMTDAGFTVLVNRGFVPRDRQAASSRSAGEIEGPTTVTGLLRMSEPDGGFLRANDPAAGRWYSRDVAAIAAAHGLGRAAPYFIDADATPNAGGLPVGGLTVLDFPNNHLIYAVTWFALAVLLVGVAGYAGREEWRRRRTRLDGSVAAPQ